MNVGYGDELRRVRVGDKALWNEEDIAVWQQVYVMLGHLMRPHELWPVASCVLDALTPNGCDERSLEILAAVVGHQHYEAVDGVADEQYRMRVSQYLALLDIVRPRVSSRTMTLNNGAHLSGRWDVLHREQDGE